VRARRGPDGRASAIVAAQQSPVTSRFGRPLLPARYDKCVKILRAALLALAATTTFAAAQTAPFVPLETFAPLTLPDPVNAYRSANGAPGPSYWQNRADYEIHAAIDTATKTLSATETITYTNNSPDTLTSLWLNLEQNIYRKDSRANAFSGGGRRRSAATDAVVNTEGYGIAAIELEPATPKSPKLIAARTVTSDTRLQIQLDETTPLVPHGTVRILIKYRYTVPGTFGGRTSWAAYKQGDIYDIAQWYPRMCVYDDLRGWDTQPYLANEFYLEYGHFDYSITVPSNFLVTGSGELVNPAEVLSKPEQQRLAQARISDKTVLIRTPEEATAAANDHPTTTKTWRFSMDSTRDVVFTASPAFIWDAARINVPAGAGKPAHAALAQSVYPVEAIATADGWSHSTEIVKDTVERMSAHWYPYPWPNAISVAGPTSGMEYPGVVFDGPDEAGKVLFFITAHEIGHTWFPMIVGSNERRDAWIDEGFNTFIDTFESDEFNHGQYGPKRDSEYAPGGGRPADEIAKVIADDAAAHGPTLLTRADAIAETYRHPITYFKSAFGLTLLREGILGPERFDHAFRKFIAEWAFKHPSPSDFFRAMASEGGEDLDYFWRGWYFHNWQLDMAVTAAVPVDPADTSKGIRVTVSNLGQLVLPATLRVELAGGSHMDINIPAETWMQNTSHTFTIPTTLAVTTVTLDPDHQIPDVDRTNNTFTLKTP